MCSAVERRITLIGSEWTRPACAGAGAGGGVSTGTAPASRGGGATAAGVSAVFNTVRMSFLDIRPPAAVPSTVERSMLRSRAIRRTKGEDRGGPPAVVGRAWREGEAGGFGAGGGSGGTAGRFLVPDGVG